MGAPASDVETAFSALSCRGAPRGTVHVGSVWRNKSSWCWQADRRYEHHHISFVVFPTWHFTVGTRPYSREMWHSNQHLNVGPKMFSGCHLDVLKFLAFFGVLAINTFTACTLWGCPALTVLWVATVHADKQQLSGMEWPSWHGLCVCIKTKLLLYF